jgi:hypothetical protein
MKIQIVQAEIEQAIVDYISSQIVIKDGMNISVEFTATRGNEGIKADIDISNKAAVVTPTAVPQKAPVAAPVVAEVQTPEPVEEVAAEVDSEPETTEHVEAEPVEVVVEPEVEAPKPRSLFKGLTKPVNAK